MCGRCTEWACATRAHASTGEEIAVILKYVKIAVISGAAMIFGNSRMLESTKDTFQETFMPGRLAPPLDATRGDPF